MDVHKYRNCSKQNMYMEDKKHLYQFIFQHFRQILRFIFLTEIQMILPVLFQHIHLGAHFCANFCL